MKINELVANYGYQFLPFPSEQSACSPVMCVARENVRSRRWCIILSDQGARHC